jgi:acetyl-CoA acetyltransferase family protein
MARWNDEQSSRDYNANRLLPAGETCLPRSRNRWLARRGKGIVGGNTEEPTPKSIYTEVCLVASLREAVIVDAVRTAIGRAGERGVFRDVRSEDLGAAVVKALLEKTGVKPEAIDDVIFGCANQAEEQNLNVARRIVLLAGLPYEVPGVSVNRLCSSSLQAINYAAMQIMTGFGDIIIAGGVEHMTHLPMSRDIDIHPKHFEMLDAASFIMGQTAEKLVERFGVTRQEMDAYSLESHRRAVAAMREGKFKDEIVPTPGHNEQGDPITVDTDQHPRPDTSLEKLAALEPAFRMRGTITAGNSSGINDGAAAVLVMSKEKAKELGLRPMAAVRSMASVGVDPAIMGVGPIYATKKALAYLNMQPSDLGLAEVNEAFAVVALLAVREIPLDHASTNVNGGAVALGHPLGCSGARITTTLLHEMRRRNVRWGLATMCVGFGQGTATIFEQET